MMKMYIELNENKIKEDNIYNIEDINKYLNILYTAYNLKVDSQKYIAGSFESLGSIFLTLKKQEWLKKYITKWLWFDDEDDSIEDLITNKRIESYAKEVE